MENSVIIANNCMAGYLNRLLFDEPYSSPLVWGGPTEAQYMKLVREFDKMNFSSFEMIEWEDTHFCRNQKSYLCGKTFDEMNASYGVEFDNGVQLIYPYYHSKEEIQSAYEKRLGRFDGKEPIFVFYQKNCERRFIDEFYRLRTRHRKVLVVDDATIAQEYKVTDKTLVLYDEHTEYFKDLAYMVAHRMRRHFCPREKVRAAICAIIKDEHRYLKEWIDYHLSIGFGRIYLYEDFTSESHKDIVKDYGDAVELHSMREIKGCHRDKASRQCAVYNWFVKNMRHACDWCLFSDIDEFFRLDCPLDELLDEFDDEHGIQVWWKVYGCGGHISRPDCGVQDAYGKDFKPHVKHGITNYDYKSFVNMRKPIEGEGFYNCHYHRKIVNTHHRRADYRYTNNELTWDRCYIDHYMTKSWEDWQARLKRGNITKGIRDVEYFFKINPEMRERIILDDCLA